MKRPCTKRKYYISVKGADKTIYEWSTGPDGTPRWTTRHGTSYRAHDLGTLLSFVRKGSYTQYKGWS